MRTAVSSWLFRLARWLVPGRKWSDDEDPRFVPLDAYGRFREPTPLELLRELKNAAYACANLNAATCAAHPPRLYVTTAAGQPSPRCLTRRLTAPDRRRFANKAMQVEEVVEHPLLTLLEQVNPAHNAHDLWELTTLYQEVHGSAYWLLESDPVLRVPSRVWVLPSQSVTPKRDAESPRLVDYYEVRTGRQPLRYRPDEVIHFRYPDPADPYLGGLSPLKAAFESAALSSQFLAYKRSLWDNSALPGVVVSPEESITDEERDRIETLWNQRFRRGGAGRVLVADSGLNVDVIQTSLADVAALAEAGATREDIANAFGIPLSYFTTDTNLANLQAADHQYLARTIRPRLARRDQKLNEQLVPLFDPSGRLFLASDDPVPANVEADRAQEEQDLRLGVRTVNEVRSERGLAPVEWGDAPWSAERRARSAEDNQT